MYFDQNMIIDATRGSIARFVNHSCEPNCRMEKWTVAGKPRMALFAGENGIMTGQELSYDYNFKLVSLTRPLPLIILTIRLARTLARTSSSAAVEQRTAEEFLALVQRIRINAPRLSMRRRF